MDINTLVRSVFRLGQLHGEPQRIDVERSDQAFTAVARVTDAITEHVFTLTKERDEAQSSLDALSTRFTALMQQNNTLAAESERLSDELSKAETERDYQKLLAIDCAEQCIKSGNEIVELSEKLAAMESQKFNVKEFIRRCQDRWSFDVKIAAEMLEIAKYTPPVPADKPAVAVPVEMTKMKSLDLIPDVNDDYGSNLFVKGWNDCRNAMLAASPSHSQQSAAEPLSDEEIEDELNSGGYSYPMHGAHVFDFARAIERIVLSDRCPSHESEQQ